MIASEYYQMINRLTERTIEGDVNWKTTSDENQFIVYFKQFSLSVRNGHDRHEEIDFISISIHNNTGDVIDGFFVTEGDNHWEQVSSLYAGARRKALDIDKAIHSMMEELDSYDEGVGENNPFDLDTETPL